MPRTKPPKSQLQSVRLSPFLSSELRTLSKLTGRTRSAIIQDALDEYLRLHSRTLLAEQAARESAIINAAFDPDDPWLHSADTTGWK